MTTSKVDIHEIDYRELHALYAAGDYDGLSDRWLALWRHFHEQTYVALPDRTLAAVNAFVKHFLHLFTQPDYRISDRHVVPFLELNLTISNVMAMSAFRTTDPWLELLKRQEANFLKILVLYSARNSVAFDRKQLLDASPVMAGIWYMAFCEGYRSGLVRRDVRDRLREHMAFQDPRLISLYHAHELFFGATYIDGERDRLVKATINSACRRQLDGSQIKNRPRQRRMAVLSGVWWPGHSVYRNYFSYLKSMRGWHLTLFKLGHSQVPMDESLFAEVRQIALANGKLNIGPLAENDFQVAYYPDIGMTMESLLLSNLRVAPIQIASLGHSVSTWGGEIDYFFSGADVERPDRPEDNYSERLVLLPGCGIIHNVPLHNPRYTAPQASPFIINCPWFAQKVNHGFCLTLQKLLERSPRPVVLRLFSGNSLVRQNDFLPFVTDLRALLGADRVEVMSALPYAQYMERLEQGQFTIDSFHFGGCNTVVDSLFVARPIVTWAGDKWYNRIGSQLVRMAGLEELAAENEEQYLDKALRLISDDTYRANCVRRLRTIDFAATLCDPSDGRYFQKAVERLTAEHEQLCAQSGRSPVRIERD
jgi:hypothetical protein